MALQSRKPRWASLALAVALVSGLLLGLGQQNAAAHENEGPLAQDLPPVTLYLPLVTQTYPWQNPFGVELTTGVRATDPSLQNHLTALNAAYVRLNTRISWRALQPEENGPIHWDVLSRSGYDAELQALNSLGIQPITIIDDYPDWAVEARTDGLTANCGPIRADKFGAYAAFLEQLVRRYSSPLYNAHIWELGNEVDVDRAILSDSDSNVFGCWGDSDDPYYGGRHYGEMLKVVTPMIKAADPSAQVWVGGLLLDSPDTAGDVKPERFINGVLEADAGDYFDVLPFHVYSVWNGQNADQDNDDPTWKWYSWGGTVTGKANFLRSILDQYGVNKPLFVDEISLTLNCPDNQPDCQPPDFYNAQANYLVRTYLRGLNAGITGYTWYTLDGPGWRDGALLDQDQAGTRPVYVAHTTMSGILDRTSFEGAVDYGSAVEAYAFRKTGQRIHVLWNRTDNTTTVSIPAAEVVSVTNRDGDDVTPVATNGQVQVQVGFEPIYVTLR